MAHHSFLVPGACALMLTAIASLASTDPPPLPEPRSATPTLRLQPTRGAHLDFALIPAGKFRMGDPSYGTGGLFVALIELSIGHGSGRPDDAGPVRETTITRPFYLGRTKVTVAQYCEFLNRTPDPDRFVVVNAWSLVVKREDGHYVPEPGFEDVAINTVPWDGAVAYCAWLTATTGLTARLPTEAEWEWAARGTEGRQFPWGHEMDVSKDYGIDLIVPAGTHPANATPHGIIDMVGFTAEWCSDVYKPKYDPEDRTDPAGPAAGDREPGEPVRRVLRGRGPVTWERRRQPEGKAGVQGGFYGFRVLIETKAKEGEPTTPAENPPSR